MTRGGEKGMWRRKSYKDVPNLRIKGRSDGTEDEGMEDREK